MAIDVGKMAPAFTLPDATGDKVALKDFAGQPVLIYFYPKDDTPGCTTQACNIRDDWAAFQKAGVAVIGISPDDVDAHRAFADKYDLPHTLLADPSKKVLEKYEAWGEKVLYGKKSVGVIRSSVLLDADHKIIKRWKKAGAKAHADQALKAIDELL